MDCAIEIRLDSRVKECVQINNLVQWAQKLCYECDSRGYNSYYQSSTTIMLVTIYDIITRMVQIITANAFIMMTVGGCAFSQVLMLLTVRGSRAGQDLGAGDWQQVQVVVCRGAGA